MYEAIHSLLFNLSSSGEDIWSLGTLVTAFVCLGLWAKFVWRFGSAILEEVLAKIAPSRPAEAKPTKRVAPSFLEESFQRK